MLKNCTWHFDTKKVIRQFPEIVRKNVGLALYVLQRGETPTNVKKLKGLSGAYEITVRGPDNTYRVVYAFIEKDSINVISAFVKKSKTGIKTPQSEIDKIRERMKEIRGKPT
tara:strand:+ start:17237 stop:17572 length:336 start_codon:yes stop_codon:yes gene_type:complete